MNLAAAGTSFLIVLPAELPDKTVLACLVMGSRYRPAFVFAGAAAAFTAHVVLAVTAGSLLGLLPHRPVQAVAGVLFLFGAVLVWRQHRQDSSDDVAEHGRSSRLLPVAAMAFAVVFAAEFGDLTRCSRWAWRPGTATRWRWGRWSSKAAGYRMRSDSRR